MGSAAPKPRPMRSKRSSKKTEKLVNANLEILKKLKQNDKVTKPTK